MMTVPQHVAIIMDGNRRWAKKRKLPNIVGHRQGVKTVEKVIEAAGSTGVKILTLYTFSTENWRRPGYEVAALTNLMEEYIDSEHRKLAENNIRLNIIGRLDRFPPTLRRKIENVRKETSSNTGLLLNIALDYGARGEIVDVARRVAEDVKTGKIKSGDISEKLFSEYLYTASIPDPDLLIRTGGELRVSNFLLWQICYSEIYITERLWPDFGKKDFEKAVADYAKRERRLGG